jgi:hypothetical protein
VQRGCELQALAGQYGPCCCVERSVRRRPKWYFAPAMSRDDAIELVRQLEEAVNAHDTARLLDLYAEGAVMFTLTIVRYRGKT